MLTELMMGFCSYGASRMMWPEQEDFLAMLAPLVQLRRLEVEYAARLNARVAVPLQHMLPQLQVLTLQHCGRELPMAPAHYPRERQEELLGKVRQLLRPGLQLVVQPG
jgi:hypothetical protein